MSEKAEKNDEESKRKGKGSFPTLSQIDSVEELEHKSVNTSFSAN